MYTHQLPLYNNSFTLSGGIHNFHTGFKWHAQQPVLKQTMKAQAVQVACVLLLYFFVAAQR